MAQTWGQTKAPASHRAARNLAAATLLSVLASVVHAADDFSVTKLKDNVFAILRNDPPGYAVESNSGFIECDEHLVVIDAQSNDATTSRVLAAIRRHSGKPVRYLINTHWHDDHIVGNRIYREAFASMQVIGHSASLDYLPAEGVRDRERFHRAIPDVLDRFRNVLRSGRTSDGKRLSEERRRSLESDVRLARGYATVPEEFAAILPDLPVKDKYSIRDAGCVIDVLALGNAHTTGDLVVHLPEQSIAFVGDIVGWPVPLVGPDQSRVREWPGTLQRVRDLKAAMIVPGHGPVLHDNAHIDRTIELMTVIARRVDGVRTGSSSADVARSRINLSDLRRDFAAGSEVNGALFDGYVAGPAVINVWNIR